MQEINNIPGAPANRGAGNFNDKIEAARQITALFKMERYAYVSSCAIAVGLLIFCAFDIIRTKPPNYSVLLGSLFGSGGLIAYSVGRLIFMWNKVVDLVLTEGVQRGGGQSDGN